MKISHAFQSILWTDKSAGRKSFLTRKLGLTSLCLTSALLLAAGPLCGQSAIQINGEDVTIGAEEESGDSSAPYVIFSNLGPKNDPYDTTAPFAFPVVGRKVNQTPEEWLAIRFVPEVDVQATKIEAAVGWEDGKKLVQLGIYTNDDTFQTPGTVLPGGQGSTNDIPNLDECCGLTTVTLPDPGVTLTAGTIYWLVCSTDEMYGTSFKGGWQRSHSGASAVMAPPSLPWIRGAGQWLAARISGSRLQTLGPLSAQRQESASLQPRAGSGKVRIFSNLNPLLPQPYLPGFGFTIAGNNVLFNVEQWRALPFTPKTDVNAKTFSVALSHTSGTNQLNFSVYSDSGGVPGSPLPGSEVSITDLPESGDCCDFATVRLPGTGIALTGGVQYWVVASPDNVNAPDFLGEWQDSSNNICAELFPEQSSLWIDFSGLWMAAQIRGQGD